MSTSRSEEEQYVDLTPPEILIEARNASDSLLPPKSREKYLAAYETFIQWKNSKNTQSFSENVFLAYFNELANKYKPSSLWCIYSMLKSTVKTKNNIDIHTYCKLTAFLKRRSDGYIGQKSKVLSPTDVEKFLKEAPDSQYLATKVRSHVTMLDDLVPTLATNRSTAPGHDHNFYVTFFDDVNNRYVNETHNATEEYQSFILPWWRQVLWTVLFAGMVVVATVGNLVVIWIVLANKRMRSVTNYFLVNLSVADAMVSTLNVTFNFTYMLNSDWPFGHFYCKFCQFIAVLSISASVFTLLAISVDRYVAIMSPLQPRLGKRATLGITAAIWVWSSVLSAPNLIYFTTEIDYLPDGTIRRVCFSEWPDGITTRSQLEYWYNVAFMVLTYFLPIMSMTYTYSRVGIELWGSQSIGECTQRQLDNVKSKRRVVKMMIVVVVIFAVCWLPFHVYFLVTSYYPDVVNYPHIQEIYLFIYWLAMSNSMYNPIIYCWMNSKFRRGFKQFFWCCGVFGGGGLDRRRGFGTERLDRSVRSLSPSRKNGTSTIRISMHSTYNQTLVSTA